DRRAARVVGRRARRAHRRAAPRRAAPLPLLVRAGVTAPVTAPITLRELDAIDVGRLKGVGEAKRKALAAVGIDTVLDLVTYYPRRWIDRSKEARVADLQPGEDALVLVTVRRVVKRVTRNRRTMVTATVGDGSGRMSVVFFNQPWRERQLKEGLEV